MTAPTIEHDGRQTGNLGTLVGIMGRCEFRIGPRLAPQTHDLKRCRRPLPVDGCALVRAGSRTDRHLRRRRNRHGPIRRRRAARPSPGYAPTASPCRRPLLTPSAPTDAPAILELIKALAEYERELDAVEATVESLLDTIAFAPADSASDSPSAPDTEPTSPTRPARCLLLFAPGGQAVGMALYFYNYSTWRSKHGIYLEDIFVQPSERGKGYGKRLLVELAKQVDATKGGRLDWVVLKWNKPSIDWYQAMGATAQDEWVGMRVDGPALHKLAHLLD